jgi:anaerobic ribonucleoside-triphosphate reductase activating protein
MKIANIVRSSSVWKDNKYIIWTQGCNKRCKNCIAKEWQSIDGGYNIKIEDIIKDITNNPNIDGIVVSGGEPFLQEKELVFLLDTLKSKTNLGSIVYTGYNYSEVKNREALKYIDLLISGEYIDELNNNKGLSGSSNQEFTFLSNKYLKDKEFYINGERVLEFNINNNFITMVGIPPIGFK